MARPSKDFQAFRDLTDRLLTVPKAVVAERHAEHREQSAQNPRKRGPKPKSAPNSDAPDPAGASGAAAVACWPSSAQSLLKSASCWPLAA